nr:uncharacterized protein LOC113829584 [Penaeus vannamei]
MGVLWVLQVLLVWAVTGSGGVDVHFLNPDSGFFLRPEDTLGAPLTAGVGGGDGGVLDVKRFTVLDPTRPTLIRAKYGPFSTKQTVPARYVLPEFQDEEEANATEADLLGRHLPPVPHQLEVSAHLVNTEVTRAHPALRVLVHGAGARGHHSPHVCVTVIARRRNDALSASCTPTGAKETGGDATCLVTMAVPARWWPPHTRATFKLPRVAVQVSYLVGTAAGPKECAVRDAGGPNQGGPRVTVQPETPVGEVVLTLDPHGYEELSSDPSLRARALVPRAPLAPRHHLHAPLYLHRPGTCRRSCSCSAPPRPGCSRAMARYPSHGDLASYCQLGLFAALFVATIAALLPAAGFDHESLAILSSDVLPLDGRLGWNDEIRPLDLQPRQALKDFIRVPPVRFPGSQAVFSRRGGGRVVVGTPRLRQCAGGERRLCEHLRDARASGRARPRAPVKGAANFTATQDGRGPRGPVPNRGYFLDLFSPAIANNASCKGSAKDCYSEHLTAVLAELEQGEWVDSLTRTVSLSFTLYDKENEIF